jgi:hypothetical protein
MPFYGARIPAKLTPEQLRLAQESGTITVEADLGITFPTTILQGLINALNIQKEMFEKRDNINKTDHGTRDSALSGKSLKTNPLNSTWTVTVQKEGSATSTTWISSSWTSQGSVIGTTEKRHESVENAVYGYLQAIRALDRTRVTTSEIASALSIPQAMVISVIPSLKVKGVR